MLGLAPAFALGLRRGEAAQPAGRRADRAIPATGIGHRIRHLSYSDMGGRPDSVQDVSVGHRGSIQKEYSSPVST